MNRRYYSKSEHATLNHRLSAVPQCHLKGMLLMHILPNILSIARMVLSLCLVMLTAHPSAFIGVYILCGASDVLDGLLARRFHWESKLGERLDSLGDFIFTMVILFLLLSAIGFEDHLWLPIGIVTVFFIRIINLLTTRRRFKIWNVIHTRANKTMGLLLYVAVPFLVLYQAALPLVGGILCVMGVVASLEETAIILTTGAYDANRKGFFDRRHNKT